MKQSRNVNTARKYSEVLIIILCLWMIWTQSVAYPEILLDPDPDGYTGYAARLREKFEIERGFHRYPGYPVIINIANAIFPPGTITSIGQIHRPIHILQSIVVLVFVAAFFFVSRRCFGTLVAWIGLALFAFPNFLVLYTSYPFPDFLGSIVWAGCFLYLSHWINNEAIIPDWLVFFIFIIAVFFLQLMKPNAAMVLFLFSVSLIFFTLWNIVKTRRLSNIYKKQLVKGGILVLVAAILFVFIPIIFGRGPVQFVVEAAQVKIVYYLPPATQSRVEREIEAGKVEWQQKNGVRIEDENYLGEQPEIPYELVEQVWLQRLKAHPFQYVKVTLEEFLRKHYLIVDAYKPFFANTTEAMYVRILPKTSLPESKLYRSTGLLINPIGEGVVAISNVSRAIIGLVWFWVIFTIGWLQLMRLHPILTHSITLCAIMYMILNAATVFIDARYMLVFAVPIYLTEAVGISAIIRFVFQPEKRYIMEFSNEKN